MIDRTIWLRVIYLVLFSAGWLSAATQPDKAMAVTILKANIAGRTVLVRNLDGKEENVSFAPGVSVTSIAEAAMNQHLSGGVGYQFVVICEFKYGQKIIQGFYYSGREEWKTIRGSVEEINTMGRMIRLKAQDGTEHIFHASEDCALNTPKGVQMFKAWPPLQTWSAKEVVAYYMEGKTGKTVYLMELTAP